MKGVYHEIRSSKSFVILCENWDGYDLGQSPALVDDLRLNRIRFVLGSPLSYTFNQALLELIEDGTLHLLRNRWWKKNSKNDCPADAVSATFPGKGCQTYVIFISSWMRTKERIIFLPILDFGFSNLQLFRPLKLAKLFHWDLKIWVSTEKAGSFQIFRTRPKTFKSTYDI